MWVGHGIGGEMRNTAEVPLAALGKRTSDLTYDSQPSNFLGQRTRSGTGDWFQAGGESGTGESRRGGTARRRPVGTRGVCSLVQRTASMAESLKAPLWCQRTHAIQEHGRSRNPILDVKFTRQPRRMHHKLKESKSMHQRQIPGGSHAASAPVRPFETLYRASPIPGCVLW